MTRQPKRSRRRCLALVLGMALAASTVPASQVVADVDASAPASARAVHWTGVTPYRGMGTWVDIFNYEPWLNPVAGAQFMKDQGVQTIYVETSRYSRPETFRFEQALGQLLDAAHDRGIRVVAWYLAGLVDLDKDFNRSMAAIRFTSPGGERFDAFALNLESDEILDIGTRNRRAIRLSRRIGEAAPPRMGYGAIVPDPVHQMFWRPFPYRRMGRIFDVILPMSYWSYREVYKPAGVARYVSDNIRRLRSQLRGLDTRIHVPGGIANDTSLDATRAFARTVRDRGAIGGSMYDFPLTRLEQWQPLRRLRTRR